MTDEQVEKLEPGDEIIVTTHDGCGGCEWGTILTVSGLTENGILVGNVTILEPRRVDLYRKKNKAKPAL